MKKIRTSGRRRPTAVAVTVVLAATAGTLSAIPAHAAPAPAPVSVPARTPAATGQQTTAPVPFPLGADVVGAGPGGFLSKTRGSTPEYRWTWYADGSSVVLPETSAASAGGVSDLVVTVDRSAPAAGRVLRVYDLSAPATAAPSPREVDLDALGDGYFFEGLAGSTLLLGRHQEGEPAKQYTVALDGDTLTPEWRDGSTGFDCYEGEEGWTDGVSVLYECHSDQLGMSAKVLVDPVSGARSTYVQSRDQWARSGAVSATHVAWREARMSGGRAVHGIVAHQRGRSGELWFPSDAELTDPVYLVGDWIASGQKAHIDASGRANADDSPARPFTVRSTGTGEEAVLLTAFSSAAPGPGGTLLVRGGTPEQGEGLYRISPRADGGRPTVEKVASTGQSTVVALTGSSVPTEVSGEQAARGIDFAWDLSRADSKVGLTLTHVSGGGTLYDGWLVPSGVTAGTPRRLTWHWDGKDLEYPHLGLPARGGEYEWRITARPDEGVGPDLVATGRFTVARPAAPHDYDDDGTADLLVRDRAGVLWRGGTVPTAPGGSPKGSYLSKVGAGWQVYDRLETAGNIAGTAAPDVVARDGAGVLWLYQGTGDRDRALSGRTRIGGGWQVYDRITAGSDVTGDGRPDLLAADKAGVLWLHPGTGNAGVPFSARKQVGGGWGVYNEIAATGDLGGASAGDLVARDKDGVLWLYLGKGDGTFAARTRIGAGWGGFTDLVGVGDANGDGRADLIASNGSATFYAGTGAWNAPFKAGAMTDVAAGTEYDTAF